MSILEEHLARIEDLAYELEVTKRALLQAQKVVLAYRNRINRLANELEAAAPLEDGAPDEDRA